MFDGNTHADIDTCLSCFQGRLHIEGDSGHPSGVVVENSVFSGGDSDGFARTRTAFGSSATSSLASATGTLSTPIRSRSTADERRHPPELLPRQRGVGGDHDGRWRTRQPGGGQRRCGRRPDVGDQLARRRRLGDPPQHARRWPVRLRAALWVHQRRHQAGRQARASHRHPRKRHGRRKQRRRRRPGAIRRRGQPHRHPDDRLRQYHRPPEVHRTHHRLPRVPPRAGFAGRPRAGGPQIRGSGEAPRKCQDPASVDRA